MYKEIIVPLDGSRLAESALPHAKEIAKAFGARITLISVLEPVGVYSQPGVVGPVISVALNVKEEMDKLSQYVDQIAEGLRTEGLDVRKVIREGDPASQICDFAQESGVDLIVMSTHGRSGLRRWVYGSVADKVLRSAQTPVLLIRAVTG
jgi:nucleotide-binding universal stress UspA family protein